MRIVIIISLLMIFFECHAPDENVLYISSGEKIDPYKAIINAVGMVESGHDINAYNRIENAVGWLQIRQVRIDDYNKRTDSNYQLYEMYDSIKSVTVFMEYARVS